MAATALLGASVDGKWTAEAPGRNGNTMKQTYTFKSDGDKLTGTVSGRMGDAEISDGKIDGDHISFSVKREMNGNSFVMSYTGTVSGDNLNLKMSTPRGDREITAKREK
jgi:hypothetical protein